MRDLPAETLRRLEEFDRRRNARLAEWQRLGRSGRLRFYVDVRSGRVMEAGEEREARSSIAWTDGSESS